MAKVDQCLFGYDDGHRLLASSLSLDDQASMLTELSDLAPGAVFGKSDGYWTGIPVPQLKRYALMRTWPAPEMPRPGCVWTHAVLFDPGLLGNLKDTAQLQRLFTRPRHSRDVDHYRQPLAIDPGMRGEALPADRGRDVLVQIARVLLATLYDKTGHPLAVRNPGDADEATFAVWSQQWPRLRRNFRFQTAAKREVVSSPAARFDVTVELLGSRDNVFPDLTTAGAWLNAAAADIEEGSSGDLRAFLWVYGKDVKRQRGSFRPLVEIKLLDNICGSSVGNRLIEIINRHFPEVDDGKTLKQDIADGSVAPDAQLDIIRHILIEGEHAVFPTPSAAGVARLISLWPDKPAELLTLAESTADVKEGLGRFVFENVIRSIPSHKFWELTAPFARVRQKMISERPELLVLDGASDLSDADFSRYVDLVPVDAPLAVELVKNLTGRNDVQLARTVLNRFQQIGAAQVIAAATVDRARVGRAWITVVVERPSILLSHDVLGQVTKPSLLYELGEELGWLTPDVVAGGVEPWIAGGLVDAVSDLSGEHLDILRAFIVALGLAAGGNGARRALEMFFEPVHDRILRSRLPGRARDILSPILPELGWLRGWDFGLRLRLAVAQCYIKNGFPSESFAGLSADTTVKELLGDAAAEIKGGKHYARAMGR